MKHVTCGKSLVVLFTGLIIFGYSLTSRAADDVVPFFAGGKGLPNVMMIMDNSDSMQDSAYFRDDGNIYRPGTYWRRGVEVNPDCNGDGTEDDPCILENASGNIVYDQGKYVTETNELVLPGSAPPHLPGIAASSSVITYIRNTSNNRIYDSNVDWQHFANVNGGWSNFSLVYRYWKVAIRDITDSTVQYRNLNSYSISSGFWYLNGGDVEYNLAHSYEYELLAGQPGEVTYPRGDNPQYVYDRNFNWSTITDWTAFSNAYRYRILEVYEGTNAGEQRQINSRSSGSGYWTLSEAFPVPCDYTSRYRILGEADDNMRAYGGNHPDSKMFQAKKALRMFLESDSITDPVDDTRFLMNLGFSTFLQARVPRTRARYYRKRAGTTVHYDAEFSYRYRQNSYEAEWVDNPNGCSNGSPVLPTNFTYSRDNTTHTGVDYDYLLPRYYNTGSCDEQTILYKVADIYCDPTDSLPNRLRIKFESDPAWAAEAEMGVDPDGNPQWGYTRYGWQYFDDDGSGDCNNFTPPATVNGWDLVASNEQCYQDCREHPERDVISDSYYQTTEHTTYGDLRITDPSGSRYIDKIPPAHAPYSVNPDLGYCSIPGDDWLCTSPNPEPVAGNTYGNWTLVENDLVDVPINADGDLGTILPLIYDYSYFRIPGRSGYTSGENFITDSNHPHGWSYRRTEKPSWENRTMDDGSALDDHYIYLRSASYWSYWGDDMQRGFRGVAGEENFPSVAGNPLSKFSNYSGDDQAVFVDLPVVVEGADDKGDDVTGMNKDKIISFLSLNRVPHPAVSNRVETMAPLNSGSLAVSSYTARSGEGTPLAASLADARKYFESYIGQDSFTLGGCRENYVILLTDGLETCTVNADGAIDLDLGEAATVEEALALSNLVVDGKETPVKVYVIGFGLDKNSKATLNAIAEAGGTNNEDDPDNFAYFANNLDELVEALGDIAESTQEGSYGRSTAAISKAGLQAQTDLSLYYAYFDYPTWRGHLEAFDLDPETGAMVGIKAAWAGLCTETVEPGHEADAGCIMASQYTDGGSPPDGPATRRTLFTSVDDGNGVLERVDFYPDNAGILKDLLLSSAADKDIDVNGTPNEDDDARAVINYVHHPGYDNGAYEGNRDENWPLADIYNSGPVIVTAPVNGGCGDLDGDGTETWDNMDGYCSFKDAHSGRDTVLYVGTNGGMIEALLESNGTEKWGYIPNSVLGTVHEFQFGHRFTMDLSILAGDVDTSVGLAGTGWKTMLVAGQRRGGNSYVALDVTDPDNPLPMWEFVDTHKIDEADATEVRDNMGQTWSRPSFGRILINGVRTSVVFFGGGYSPYDNRGNRVYIVRADDGQLIKEFEIPGASNDVPGGLRTIRYRSSKVGTVVDYRTNQAMLPDGTAVDYSDRKYFIETAYFGDIQGTIWRLSNLNEPAGPDTADPFGPPWSDTVSLTRLYVPDNDQKMPIYYRPAVSDINKGSIDADGNMSGCVKRYVLVGTGNEQSPTAADDGSNPIINYFFEIEDREWNDDDDDHDPVWSPQEVLDGKFRLNWRFALGLQLPGDQYGFLVEADGNTRVQKDGLDIMGSYVLDMSEFIENGWSIVDGHLYNSDSTKLLNEGEYVIRHDVGAGAGRQDNHLYTDDLGGTQVALYDSYVYRDTSLWLTDENGCFFDTDGTCLVDTNNYHYNIDGYLTDGDGGPEIVVNGDRVLVITDPGEKILSEPGAFAGNVYFTSYTPEGGCAMGASYLYGLEISTCRGTGGDGVLGHDAEGNPLPRDKRRIGLGPGITPGVTIASPKAYVPIFDGGEPKVKSFDIPTEPLKLKYWKQN